MFKSRGIKSKVLGISCLLAFFTLTVGVVGVEALISTSKYYDHVARQNLKSITELGEMTNGYRRSRGFVPILAIAEISDQQRADVIQKTQEGLESYRKAAASYSADELDPEESKVYDTVASTFADWEKLAATMIELTRSKDEAKQAKLTALVVGPMMTIGDQMALSLGQLIKMQTDEGKEWVGRAESARDAGTSLAITFAALGTVVSFVVGVLFARSLARNLSGVAERLSSGAAVVATASRQVSDSSTQLSSSTTEQAAALQETVAAVDEINAMIGRNAEAATRSQEVSSASNAAAVQGKSAVDQMIAAIAEIDASCASVAQQTDASHHEIAEIVKVISEIGSKTKVINDIVFQTKLLSFNASVEAARAGEQGKGFAVVAEEVGNLATMSGKAAREISDLLESSIRKVESIVDESKRGIETLMRSTKEKVDYGTRTAANCGEALDSLVRYAGDLNKMVTEIATGCKEQASGIAEINQAISSLDQVTHQNASAAEESAAAAGRLDQEAYAVEATAGSLLAIVHGEGQGVVDPGAKGKGVVLALKKPEAKAVGVVGSVPAADQRNAFDRAS